jgi:transcriptional regulator with XRE-family HTH domain
VRAQEQFGVNLRERRTIAGWSQETLSLRCGMHLTEISRLENGHRNPRLDTIVKLADALGISPRDLLVRIGAFDDEPG